MVKALRATCFFIFLALLFNAFIYFYLGEKPATDFFIGYLLEKSLSLDNLLVITIIFSAHKIPLTLQHRVLNYGIYSAIFLRGLLIFAGVALVETFSWILYIFGVLLLYSGWRLLQEKEEEEKTKTNFRIPFLPMTSQLHGQSFFVKTEGVWKATPLFLVLLKIEFSDVIFAVDSVPAIFSVTLDPFIVYTSNIFAILGLRSLYFLLAPMIDRFIYLQKSLSILLIFIGAKMLIDPFYHISNVVSLLVIFATIGGGILFSVYKRNKHLN